MSKSTDEQLNFYQCIQLLDALVANDQIQQDPQNKQNILVYRSAGEDTPEGWYSQNLMSAASELANQPDEQKILLDRLQEVTGQQIELERTPPFADMGLNPSKQHTKENLERD